MPLLSDLIYNPLPTLALTCGAVFNGVNLGTALDRTDVTITDQEGSTPYTLTIQALSAVKSITLMIDGNQLSAINLAAVCTHIDIHGVTPNPLSTLNWGSNHLVSVAFTGDLPALVNVDLSNNSLDQASVDGILALVAANGVSSGILNLGGGSNSPPTPSAPPTAAHFVYAPPSASFLMASEGGEGEYLTMTLPDSSTTYVFWFNNNGNNTQPSSVGVTGSGVYVEVDTGGSMSNTDVGDLLASLMISGFGSLVTNVNSNHLDGTLVFDFVPTGPCGDIPRVHSAGGFNAFTDGTLVVPNANITTLQSLFWTVTTN